MLRDARFEATLPVVNMERAKKFYQETLGLRLFENSITGGPEFESGEGTRFALYERETPSVSDHTAGGWVVKDVERVVEALSERGVVFEQYDTPELKTDARGIATMGPWKGAFLKDPDGNILGIAQFN